MGSGERFLPEEGRQRQIEGRPRGAFQGERVPREDGVEASVCQRGTGAVGGEQSGPLELLLSGHQAGVIKDDVENLSDNCMVKGFQQSWTPFIGERGALRALWQDCNDFIFGRAPSPWQVEVPRPGIQLWPQL